MRPFLLLFVFLAACSPIQVLDQEPVDDFALNKYRTFSFYQVEGDSIHSKNYLAGIEALKTQITQQLQMRGLQPGDTEPDLLVNIGVMIQPRARSKTAGLRYMGNKPYNKEHTTAEAGQHYNEGTVTIHLVDRAQNKLVWRGAVEGMVPNKQARLERDAADAMEALFKGL